MVNIAWKEIIMSEWLDGKIYPNESGYYRARFKSGRIRVAYFTLVTTPNDKRKSWGRWGSNHPYENYIPFSDPIEWKLDLCQADEKINSDN